MKNNSTTLMIIVNPLHYHLNDHCKYFRLLVKDIWLIKRWKKKWALYILLTKKELVYICKSTSWNSDIRIMVYWNFCLCKKINLFFFYDINISTYYTQFHMVTHSYLIKNEAFHWIHTSQNQFYPCYELFLGKYVES